MTNVNKTEKTTMELLKDLIVSLILIFFLPLCMRWGWNVLAPHLNAPVFGYWEMMGIRLGLCAITSTFKK